MEVDSDANSSFLSATRSFVDWFQALPGATFHKDIAIEDLRGRNAGRGIGEWGEEIKKIKIKIKIKIKDSPTGVKKG